MKRFLLLFSIAFLVGCVEYHPYDMRIEGAKGVNAANIERIECECVGKRELKVAVISDSQRWYDELEDAIEDINSRDDIDFVLHAGDVADFGLRDEFEIQRDMLQKLERPSVCLIGNHDCLATGEYVFQEVFGELNFAFTAAGVRFICLNTNALEFDIREPVPNFEFLDEQIRLSPDGGATRSVVVMHAQPYSDQFNNNVATIFQHYLHRFPDLLFCVHGHGHSFREVDIFGDGIVYYQTDCVGHRGYLIFTINEEGYECEQVRF